MAPITWPASFLLAVLVVCASGLTWKGLIPIHVFFTIGGMILGYLIPKGSGQLSLERRARRSDAEEEREASSTFTREEIPTRKTVPDIMVAKEGAKEDVKKNE